MVTRRGHLAAPSVDTGVGYSASQARGCDIEVTSQATQNGRGQATFQRAETTPAATHGWWCGHRGGSHVQTAIGLVPARPEAALPLVTEGGTLQGAGPCAGGGWRQR